MKKTLSSPALKVINDYLHLPITGHDISCPYFNNRRIKTRGGLRVLVGKGTAKDISDEITIISLRERIDLEKLTDDELKKFIVDNNIGIDCSALAYYILDAELKDKNKNEIKKILKFPHIKNPLRKLLIKLRPVENVGVRTFDNEINSAKVELKNVEPGDIITMINTGLNHDRNHILIIHQVDYSEDNKPQIIYYTHSFQWTADGKYNHGIKQGLIKINQIENSLLNQEWQENDKKAFENETYQHAKMAEKLEIKRIK